MGINTVIETNKDEISQILKFFNIYNLLYKKKIFLKAKYLLVNKKFKCPRQFLGKGKDPKGE